MATLIEKIGPIRPVQQRESIFSAVAKTIIRQQLSESAAQAIQRRVTGTLRDKFLTPTAFLAIAPEDLRAAGLSGSKAKFIRGIAEAVISGEFPDSRNLRKLRDEEICLKLRQFKGLGQWTVDMLLIFHLGRNDVLPLGDVALQRAFSKWFSPTGKYLAGDFIKRSKLWIPYRTTAMRYLWRSLTLPD